MLAFLKQVRHKTLSSNKFSIYILYALGEIILVVVGILIAISIDDWQNSIVNKNLKQKIQVSIKQDLLYDLKSIDSSLYYLNKDQALFDTLHMQLTSSSITKDEVIELIQNNYDPLVAPIFGFRSNTYHRIVADGSVELLSDTLKAQLYNHYLLQDESIKTIQTYESLYINAVSEFIKHFPLKNSFVTFNKGYVYDYKWQNPDFDLLTSSFNSVGTSKKNYYRIMSMFLHRIRSKTVALTELLDTQPH